MNRKSIFGVLASALLLLAARKAVQRRNKGWFVVPVGASRRARLLVTLPRLCRQGLRRLGLTLPVLEAPGGHLVALGKTGTGKTRSGSEALREQLKPGESVLFSDFDRGERPARRLADAIPGSVRTLFLFAEETSQPDTGLRMRPDCG